MVRDLDAEATAIAGHLNVQHAHAVALLAEVIDTGEWEGHGIASPEHWAKLRFGVSHPRARTLVAVARRFGEFPDTMAEFAAGGLSLEQVDVVVSRAPAWADTRMAGFAAALTVSQLHRVIRDEFFDGPDRSDATPETFDGTSDGAPAEPAPIVVPGQPADRLSYDWVGGRLVGSFDLAADRGTALVAVLQRIGDELFRHHGAPASNAEALSEAIARAGAAPNELLSLDWGNGSRLADVLGRFRTFLHLDLTDDAKRLVGQLSNGVALPDAMRQYLTCDGSVTPVWELDHTPVGYGRNVRIVPVTTRRMIERRDRGCRVPGCGAKHIEAHHIVHWEHGGVTETWNLVSLCPKHHRLHHLGQLAMRGNPDDDTLEFFGSAGRPIRGPTYARPEGPPPGPGKPYESPTGEHMDLRWFTGWIHPDTLAARRQANRHHN